MSTTADAGMDAGLQLQGELSRINLLRIRGDVSSAKTLCLSTLKKFPTSVDAHVMMGDLHAEQADLPPAAEWYALALDLDPQAPGVAVKLNRIRAAQDISKQAATQKALIDSGKKTSPWLIGGVAAIALSILTLAVVVGNQKQSPTQVAQSKPVERINAPRDFTAPVANPAIPVATNQVPAVSGSTPQNSRPAEFETAATVSNPAKSDGRKVAQDETLLSAIQERSKFGKNIISIQDDPRSMSMIITYSVAPDEHGRYTGAMVALTALEYHKKAALITLRGVRSGVLSYMADIKREKVLVAENELGSLFDQTDHSWIDQVLENEYFRSQEITGIAPR